MSMPGRALVTTILVVGLVVGLLVALATLLHSDLARRNVEWLPADMARSPALATGARSVLLPDPATGAPSGGPLPLPAPEGSVARGTIILPYGPSLEEAARAGRELPNPFAPTAAVLARGALVFGRICASCHGPSGAADAPATQRGVPPPPNLARAESRALADGEMFHALTFGRRNMASVAAQVAVDDRWKVILHLRTLQGAP